MVQRQSSFTYSNSPFINEINVALDATPGNITAEWSITAATADEVFAGSESLDGNDSDTTSITGGVSEFFSGAFVDTGEAVGEALSEGAAPYELNVSITPRSFAALQNAIGAAISTIAESANVPEFVITQQLDGIPVPSIPSVTEQTTVPVGETGSGSKSWSVPSVTIPVPDGTDFIETLESLTDTQRNVTQPKLRFTVQLPGDKVGIPGAQETFTVPVPYEAFINTRELDINCEEVYRDVVGSDINRLESRATSLQSGASEANSQLEDAVNQIATAAGTSTQSRFRTRSSSSPASSITGVTAEDIIDLGTGSLQDIRTTVESISTRVSEASELRSTYQSLQTRVEDEVGSGCVGVFQSQLDDIDTTISNVETLAEENDEMRSTLLDVLSGIESLDCASIYSSINSSINDMSDRVGVGGASPEFSLPITDTVIDDVQSSIDSTREEIRSEVPSDSPCRDNLESDLDQVQSRLEQLREQAPLNCASEFSGVDQSISNLESRVGIGDASPSIQLPLSDDQFSSLTDEVSETRDEARSELPSGSPCFDEFSARLDQINTRLEQLLEQAPSPIDLSCSDVDERIRDAVDDFEQDVSGFVSAREGNRRTIIQEGNLVRGRVEDNVQDENPCKRQLLNQINSSLNTITQVQRSCADVSDNLISAASSYEGAVRQFRSEDQLARLPERKDNLISEGESIINSIENQVSDRNPCKSQLLSRVRQARSDLRSTPVRPRSAIPCDQRFSDIGRRINSFEDRVLNLTAPVSPKELQEIAQEGNAIISEINSQVPADSTCRVEMPERVRNLVERVRSLTRQVRIQTEGSDANEERRQELIRQLLSSIERVKGSSKAREGTIEEAQDIIDETT